MKTKQYRPSSRDTVFKIGHTSIYQYIHSLAVYTQPGRNNGIRGTLPTTFSTGATYRHGVGDGSYSFTTPKSYIGPVMGNFSSSKVLKKTRSSRRSSGVKLLNTHILLYTGI